jgi:hypothetical protein
MTYVVHTGSHVARPSSTECVSSALTNTSDQCAITWIKKWKLPLLSSSLLPFLSHSDPMFLKGVGEAETLPQRNSYVLTWSQGLMSIYWQVTLQLQLMKTIHYTCRRHVRSWDKCFLLPLKMTIIFVGEIPEPKKTHFFSPTLLLSFPFCENYHHTLFNVSVKYSIQYDITVPSFMPPCLWHTSTYPPHTWVLVRACVHVCVCVCVFVGLRVPCGHQYNIFSRWPTLKT